MASETINNECPAGTPVRVEVTDPGVGVWLDYDPASFQLLGSASGLIMSDGTTIAVAGAFGPWGYAAKIGVPADVRGSGRLIIRAAVKIISGSLCIGVLNEKGDGFYRQTSIIELGTHVQELTVDCPGPPSGVILRHGQPQPGNCEFELKMLTFQLRPAFGRPNLQPARKRATFTHHPIFDQFARWSGVQTTDGYRNWLGVLTRPEFSGRNWKPTAGVSRPALPALSEEYFEWIDLLECVHESADRFTMVELGAGWGRWLVNAWGALRALKQSGKLGMPVLLVGVEAEPQHFSWMRQHFLDNEIPASQFRLIEAAVNTEDGKVNFLVGNSASHYGQSMINRPYQGPLEVREVCSVSLGTVLDGTGSVDLLDMDIQGAEADLIETSRDLIHERVRRVHIGTHSDAGEARLRRTFNELGWQCNYDFRLKGLRITPFGSVQFRDGVQSWTNTNLAQADRKRGRTGVSAHRRNDR